MGETSPILFWNKKKGFPKHGWALRKPGCTDIDLISTSRDAYLSKIVFEAKVVVLKGAIRIPMITAEDLIVMKTLVGRDKDIDDTIVLRLKTKVDEASIRRTLKSFGVGYAMECLQPDQE
jgi:predicted nucleotidyltransferase